MKNAILYLLLPLTICCACHRQTRTQFVVGVSQCSDDAWRQRMNKELETELIFHPELSLRFRQAEANSALQCAQIDSFIAERIDLLIVCPNEAAEVQPAVTRAHRAGIPVVVADRRVSGSDWTAYIGGDNLQVGRLLGHRLLTHPRHAKDSLRVLEVAGLRGSTPAVARHRGMLEVISADPMISVHTVFGQWFADPAFDAVDSLLMTPYRPDVIVAQNDQMAIGAARACNRYGLKIPILGVDAIAGRGGGLEAILSGDITASALYPSRGDLVLRCAADILEGEPYVRETHLSTMMIDRETARAMQDMSELIDDELGDIRQLQDRFLLLRSQHAMQRMLIYMMIVLLILVVGAFVAAYYIIRYRARVRKEREEHEAMLQRQQEMLDMMSERLEQNHRPVPNPEELERHFVEKLTQEIDQRLGDPDLSVEGLASAMGMSRSVLFRRVKAAIGQSPVEMIRHQRLQRAKHLLDSGTMTVQEVAYEVGFSTPGYFAKCYKEEFGLSPKTTRL